ncbi:MAG: glycosyltransferase [Bacteroidia bacterium]|nr:glycosyltransferase [Bacteroidia bacterium]MDW8015402.1 glycosyltransferase [Bacteroidia bacterium]
MLPVSVVIPARNEAHNIARLVESLRTQTHPPAEIIVVDAGSEDGTAQVAAAAGARVLRVDRAYPGQARNIGIAHAKQELIACWDSSMYLQADALESLLHPLLSGTAELSIGQLKIYPQTLAAAILMLVILPPYTHRLKDGTRVYLPFIVATALYKRLWEEVGGFAPWRAREDVDFREKLLRLNPRIAYVIESVTYWEPSEKWRQIVRKMRLYGRHNLLSKKPMLWYGGVARAYGAYILIATSAAIATDVTAGLCVFGAAVLGGALLRALLRLLRHGSVFQERTGKKPFAPLSIFATWGLLLSIEAALFLGFMDWLLLDRLGFKPETFPEPKLIEEIRPTEATHERGERSYSC